MAWLLEKMTKKGKKWYVYERINGRKKCFGGSLLWKNAEELRKEVENGTFQKIHNIQDKDATVRSVYDRYIEYSTLDNKTPKTVKHIETVLKEFVEEFGRCSIASISSGMLRQFKANLVSAKKKKSKFASIQVRRFSDTSVNMRIIQIKALFNYAIGGLHLITTNPAKTDKYDKTKGINLINVPDVSRRITEAELKQLKKAADAYPSPRVNFWDIILTALSTGLRLEELASLHSSMYYNGTLTMSPHKRGQEKVIPVHQSIRHIFEDKEGFIFPGRTASNIELAWQRIKARANLNGRLRFHDLRHNCARILLEQGWTLKEIQALLGHKHSKTTERYAQYEKNHIKDKMDNTVMFKKEIYESSPPIRVV